jgi:hypothetical protein
MDAHREICERCASGHHLPTDLDVNGEHHRHKRKQNQNQHHERRTFYFHYLVLNLFKANLLIIRHPATTN